MDLSAPPDFDCSEDSQGFYFARSAIAHWMA